MPVLLSVSVVRLSKGLFRWSVTFMDECLGTGTEAKRERANEAGREFRVKALDELKRKTEKKGVKG